MKNGLIVFIFFVLCTYQAQAKMHCENGVQYAVHPPKRILYFLYTDWCSFCKAMDKQVIKSDRIQQYLKQADYQLVYLNAEDQREILFNQKLYRYKANRGYHELAIHLTNDGGKLSFPSIVILNNKYEVLYQHNQFLNTNELMSILVFYSTD